MTIKFYKLNNFTNQYGSPDWKGLDKSNNIPGSQVYKKDFSQCVLATTEETTPIHEDLIEITEQEYIAYRAAIISEEHQDVATLEQRIADLELQVAQLLAQGGTS